jgi:hypothetical protein
MATELNNKVPEAEPRPTDTDHREIAEAATRPDLVWDNEAPGLRVRVHGNGEKSFIFVYRREDRKRFVRIGTTPRWSPDGARRWAKELRSAVDRGHDPEFYNRERQKIKPVESFMQLIAETEQTDMATIKARDRGQFSGEARRIAVNIAKLRVVRAQHVMRSGAIIVGALRDPRDSLVQNGRFRLGLLGPLRASSF